MINCEYELCIYNKNYRCILEKVNIDQVGFCADSTPVMLDETFLKQEKERQLKCREQNLERQE